MKSLTVFTPTYNRAYCLGQLYDSLVRQTHQDFVWLVIDDGSTDATKAVVAGWQNENKIEIQYVYQENQGMHGAHNTAYKTIATELNVCIDSDDFMPDEAVAKLLDFWAKNKTKNVAGIIALDSFKNGAVIGNKIPDALTETTVHDLYHKHRIAGDKKLIYRTEIVKNYREYPVFKDERFVPLGILYLEIDQDYTMLTLNEVVCIVEYLPDGSSLNMFKQYKRHPKGFAYSRLIEMQYSKKVSYTFTRSMHYISSCIFQKKVTVFSGNACKLITLLALPFGILFHVYVLLKIRK
jgi:glycosyltransferase involved in cell wall biosynthesis